MKGNWPSTSLFRHTALDEQKKASKGIDVFSLKYVIVRLETKKVPRL
jgi:hypothetical protein